MRKIITNSIKSKAIQIGFDAVGIASAQKVSENDIRAFYEWIKQKGHAEMLYMEGHYDKRMDPTFLVENAKSIIVVALNYFPQQIQTDKQPQLSYYAYGEDYHEVLKEKLNKLYTEINTEIAEISGRCFVDTAPLLERYWAAQAGIGFIGKNNMLIIPQKGSFFFLGFLILDLELNYDTPMKSRCGSCTRCMDNCPTKALSPYYLDSKKCISYLTIENRNEIPDSFSQQFGKQVYGCDICQKVCPWNRFATPTHIKEFTPKEIILRIDPFILESMKQEDFSRFFKGSPVKRTKFAGLKRNWKLIRNNFDQ